MQGGPVGCQPCSLTFFRRVQAFDQGAQYDGAFRNFLVWGEGRMPEKVPREECAFPVIGPFWGLEWFLQPQYFEASNFQALHHPLSFMKFIALIHPSNVGPAYGIGQSVEEAQANATSTGFLRLGDWVAVEISQSAYETINSHGVDAVHLGLPREPQDADWRQKTA